MADSKRVAPQTPQELSQSVQDVLLRMQNRFKTLNDTIESRVNETASRLDDLERSIGELLQQASVDDRSYTSGGQQSQQQPQQSGGSKQATPRMKSISGMRLSLNKASSRPVRRAAPVAPRAAATSPEFDMTFGFRTRTARALQVREGGEIPQDLSGNVPQSINELGLQNFKRELEGLRLSVRTDDSQSLEARMKDVNPLYGIAFSINRFFLGLLAQLDKSLEEKGVLPKLDEKQFESVKLSSETLKIREMLGDLKLSNDAVLHREEERRKVVGEVPAPWFIKFPYLTLCFALDVIYANRPIQRFWVLETVARMPYFSYISILHLYESLGWHRAGLELRKVHFAEEINEFYHLSIMESLGGDQLWLDRFIAQHSALLYYWVLVILYTISPPLSYRFSELVENHAYDTYCEFTEVNKELLAKLPAPEVAVKYYNGNDLYYFDEFQTSDESMNKETRRRPQINNLFDVFCAVRDDEFEHIKTMTACAEGTIKFSLDKKAASRQN